MLRYAASLVIATYEKVGLIPQDLRALPLELFTKPHKSRHTGAGRYPEKILKLLDAGSSPA
jgi:hypothetical protein